MTRLDGKVALITGTGGGQGRAAALRFSAAGAIVVGCDVNEAGERETLDLVSKAGGKMTSSAPIDLGDPEAARKWVESAVETHGRIDIVYNNASAARFGTVADFSVEDWQWTIRNEMDLVFYVSKYAWPYLAKQGGVILNTASIAGHKASSNTPTLAHSATKGAVIAMTRQMAIEGAPVGIRALSISPGTVVTPGTAEIFANPDIRGAFESAIPLRRLAEADDIARVALFLCSDEASYMTGNDIVVDGGITVSSV